MAPLGMTTHPPTRLNRPEQDQVRDLLASVGSTDTGRILYESPQQIVRAARGAVIRPTAASRIRRGLAEYASSERDTQNNSGGR